MIPLKEATVLRAVLEWLTVHKIFHFRVNTMGTPMSSGGFRPAPTVGIPDIIAVVEGRFVGIEVKSTNGKQSQRQKMFEGQCKKAGGEYFIVKSIDDLERLMG